MGGVAEGLGDFCCDSALRSFNRCEFFGAQLPTIALLQNSFRFFAMEPPTCGIRGGVIRDRQR